jgi:hypothetical protein
MGQCVRERDGARRGQRRTQGTQQVRLRLHPAGLRRLDQAVEERGDLGPALGPGPVVILAADHRSGVICHGRWWRNRCSRWGKQRQRLIAHVLQGVL